MNKIKQSIIKDYKDKIILYEDFASSIAYILEILLKDNNFFFLTILPRVKTIDSLKDKLNRLNLKKLNVRKFSDIQDLAGVRAIFYLASDVGRFMTHIYDEFGKENIIKHELKIDEEGYNAIHLVIKLDKDRVKLKEYSKFKDLKCEIQLTTVLYHAWSEMAHNLIYKPKRELLNFDKRSFEALDKHFKGVMHHIREASSEFEVIYHRFRDIQKGKNVFDINFLKNISSEDSNNKIYRQLELLEKYTTRFGDKTPKKMDIIQLITEIIEKSKTNKVENEKTVLGDLPGKTYSDVVVKSLEILDHVRYTGILHIFNLLVKLHQDPDKKIKDKVKEVLEKLARYDFYVLRQKDVGYVIQKVVLDAILGWSQQERIKNIEAIRIITRELLQSSFEGTESDWNKLAISFGALQPTPYLKKIRRDTINLLIDLYNQVEDLKAKISLLEILDQASYFPTRGRYRQKVIIMITDDVRYLVNAYEKMVFDKGNKIIAGAPIVQEIERQLIWFNKNHKNKIPKITRLLDKIRKDEFYDLYRTLVGDIAIEKENWQKAEEVRNKKIDSEFKKISKVNIKKWTRKLNLIAKYKDIVDEWKFQVFQDFLIRIAREKSDLAEIILDDTLKNDKPLTSFVGSFLFGFRQGNNLKIWDKYVEKIIARESVDFVKGISNSFFYYTDLESVRKKDIKLLSQIIRREKPFNFLKKIEKSKLLNLNFSLIRILVNIYKSDKKQIEALIRTLIENDKNNEFLHIYVDQLAFPMNRKEIDLSGWSTENIKLILDKLVELKSLDDQAQRLLLAIAKNDFLSVIEVFIRRIRKRDKMTEKKWISFSRYDAIPYHFNNDFREYVSNHQQYPEIVEKWVREMTPKSSTYNIELAQFLQGINGPIFKDILLHLIKKRDTKNLNKVFSLLWGIDFPDFNICFEIIKRIDDVKIWNRVGGLMGNTGTVSGEYGMAEAYERKIESIKKYKSKGTKKEKDRVKRFKEKMIKDLNKLTKTERQRVNERIKLRKLEFGE